VLRRDFLRRHSFFDHAADGVDRRRSAGRELAQLPVLHEQEKPEERRVLIVRMTEAANHGTQLSADVALVLGERLKAVGELHVVAFERGPDELVFADEMAIERTFGDIDRSGDVPHAGFGDALFDEEANGGLLDAVACIGVSVSRHM